MEIPVATPAAQALVVCACALVIAAVVWWGIPRFKHFLETVAGRVPRKPGTSNAQLLLGFVVYAFVFAPAVIAGYIAFAVLTVRPTLLTSNGVTGGAVACDDSALLFNCATSFRVSQSQITLAWEQIDRVECLARSDGSIARIYVCAGKTEIAIGNFGVRDLRPAHAFIVNHSLPGAPRSCQSNF